MSLWCWLAAPASSGRNTLLTALILLSLVGVAAALLRGGSFAGWGRIRVLWWPVAVGSLAWLLLLHNHPMDRQSWAIEYGPLLWTACLAGLFVMLLRNGLGDRAHRAAWAVAALGAGLNLLVVSVNGGYMPQSAEARVTTRGAAIDTTGQPQLRNVRPMDDATLLGGLGDVLAEPAWFPKANVVSVGDVLLGIGIAWWAFSVTRSRSITRREEA